MNKYSSKAVKTAATVGMSLAMVLGNVAPVINTTMTTFAAACHTDANALADLFETAGITTDLSIYNSDSKVLLSTTGEATKYYPAGTKLGTTVKVDSTDIEVPATGLTIKGTSSGTTEITVENAKKLPLKANYGQKENVLRLYYDDAGDLKEVTEANKGTVLVEDVEIFYAVEKNNTVVETSAVPGRDEYKKLFGLITGDWKEKLENVSGDCDNETGKIADALLKLENEIATMFGADYDGTDGFVANVIALGRDVTDADLTALTRFESKYNTNLTDDQADLLNDAIEQAQDYLGYDSTTNDYQKKLSNYVDTLVKKFDEFIDDKEYTDPKDGDVITKTKIKAEIAKIKQDEGYPAGSYAKFKNEGAVEEVIASYEELYDSIEEVADAVDKKKNEAYADFLSGGSNSVKSKYSTLTVDEMIDTMKTAHYETYKAFKEAVIDVVYTMEAKEYANRFIDKSTKSAFVSVSDLNTALNNFSNGKDKDGNYSRLYEIYDDEEGTFGWDELEAHMNKVNESLTTLEDLSKYDAISLTVNDKDALIKMDDAVYFLQTDGKENLNAAQTRTVRDASRKVTELMEAYRKSFGSIDSTLNGWINKGNGDYAYYENGVAPSYKWVASGANWYFVKDGVMMRNYWLATDGGRWYYLDNEGKMVTNQSVDGCWINSYGVYVSPSYNG